MTSKSAGLETWLRSRIPDDQPEQVSGEWVAARILGRRSAAALPRLMGWGKAAAWPKFHVDED